MGKIAAPVIVPPHRRYTLHYCEMIRYGPIWSPDYFPHWNQIDCKTLKEARDLQEIAGSSAYIIDNVTNKRV